MGIHVTWTGDAKQAEKAVHSLERENTKLQERIRKLSGESKTGASEQDKLGRAARRVYEQVATPQERYQRRMQELNQLVRKGAIDQQTYRRAAAQAYEQHVAGATRAKVATSGLTTAVQSGAMAVRNMVFGLIGGHGVLGAIGMVRAAVQQWQQDMQKLAETSREWFEDLIKDMTEAGDLAQSKRIETALQVMPGVTREEARQLYGGVRGAAPRISMERVLGLTGEAARVAPLKAGRDLEAFGTLTGELAVMLPERRAEDIADLALKLQQEAGDQIVKLTGRQFKKGVEVMARAGVGPEETLAMGLGALRRGVTPEVLITAFERITAPEEKYRKTLPEFARASAAERLRMLQTDEMLARAVMGEQAIRFQQIRPEFIKQLAGELREVQAGDYVAAQVAELRKTTAGRELLRMREIRLERERTERGLEPEARRRERAQEAFEAAIAGYGPLRKRYARMAYAFGEEVSTWPGIRGTGVTGLEIGAGLMGVGTHPEVYTAARKFAEGEDQFRRQVEASEKSVDHLEEISGKLDELIDATTREGRPFGGAFGGGVWSILPKPEVGAEPAITN